MFNRESDAGKKVDEHLNHFVDSIGLHGHLAFSLVMRTEEGLNVHDRTSQPCYGELRKYYETHPDTYTDPEPKDRNRPNDLKNPFPKGVPEAVAVPFYHRVDRRIVDFLCSSASPFLKGIGDPGQIVVSDKGMIFYDTNFDPTVFVGMINFLKSFSSESALFFLNAMRDESDMLAVILGLASLNIGNLYGIVPERYVVSPAGTSGYYTPKLIDIKRFKNQDPHDLTGGLFRDGFDYNRKILHEAFGRGHSKDTTGLVDIHKHVVKELGLKKTHFGYEYPDADARRVIEILNSLLEAA